MLGINLPGFTIIDLISIEVGNWNNPFANEFYGPRKNFIPQHYGRNGWSDAINENLKWSIYLKKRFFNHFGVVVAFARDYVFDLDESSYGPNIDFEETYRYHGDYYWRLMFEGDF